LNKNLSFNGQTLVEKILIKQTTLLPFVGLNKWQGQGNIIEGFDISLVK
jgi:hypothetical protein